MRDRFLRTKDNFNIGKSLKSIGQLYPILLDSTGNHVIDGLHRLGADPKWMKVKINNIKDRKDILLARIVSNVCRRELPPQEKSEMFNTLAEELYNNYNIPQNQITKTISNLTGVSYRTVLRYLSKRYKDQRMIDVRHHRTNVANLATPTIQKIEKIFDYKNNIKEADFYLIGEKNKSVIFSNCIFKPNMEGSMHSHSSNHFISCVSGKGKYVSGHFPNTFYQIKSGSLLYCNKFETCRFITSRTAELNIVCYWNPPIKFDYMLKEDGV